MVQQREGNLCRPPTSISWSSQSSCPKGILRYVGIEPLKFHDVGPFLLEHHKRFKGITLREIRKMADISKRLRKERELAFYGGIDCGGDASIDQCAPGTTSSRTLSVMKMKAGRAAVWTHRWYLVNLDLLNDWRDTIIVHA